MLVPPTSTRQRCAHLWLAHCWLWQSTFGVPLLLISVTVTAVGVHGLTASVGGRAQAAAGVLQMFR